MINRALELSATAIILVNKHLSSDPAPVATYGRITRAIANVATPLCITLHDQLIIGRSGHASLRGLKLI